MIGGVGPAFQGHGVLWLRFSLCTVFCHVCRLMLPSVMIGVVRLCDHSLPSSVGPPVWDAGATGDTAGRIDPAAPTLCSCLLYAWMFLIF